MSWLRLIYVVDALFMTFCIVIGTLLATIAAAKSDQAGIAVVIVLAVAIAVEVLWVWPIYTWVTNPRLTSVLLIASVMASSVAIWQLGQDIPLTVGVVAMVGPVKADQEWLVVSVGYAILIGLPLVCAILKYVDYTTQTPSRTPSM